MPVVQNFQAFMNSGGLVCPAGKSKIEYGDSETPRLFVLCRASEKSIPVWQLRLTNAQGSNFLKTLGTIKDVTLTRARKLAEQFKAEHLVALQAEAAATQASATQEITLDVFMRDHFMPHCYAHIRSTKKYEQLYRLHVGPRFGHLPLSQITRRDVQAFHNQLLEKGQSPASADHSLKLLKRVMNLSVQWEFQDRNVLKGVGLLNVFNGVENYLKEGEVQRLISVLKSDSNRMVSLLLLFILSCGCRRSAAMHATWSAVDMENRVWKIPAINSKSKRPASVPLNDSAMYVLEQLDTRGKSEYLFVNKATGKPFVSIMRVWYRIKKAAGLNDKVRIHDLRHTWGSMLASKGISLYEISILMQHADQRSSARYAHVSMERLQQTSNLGSMIVRAPQPQLSAS